MLPQGLINKQQISLHHSATSKKKVLETAAELLAAGDQALVPELIYEKLLERERLGSTGLANGIALPHARIKGATEATGAIITLEETIEFDSLDGKPVDLIFALVVPEAATEVHLDLLANLAQLLRNRELRQQLRQCTEIPQVLFLLDDFRQSDVASNQGS